MQSLLEKAGIKDASKQLKASISRELNSSEWSPINSKFTVPVEDKAHQSQAAAIITTTTMPAGQIFTNPNLIQISSKGSPIGKDQSKPVFSLAFPGTGRGAAWRAQLKTNAQQFLGSGGVPAAHQQSEKLATLLKTKFGDTKNLTLTGHSLGGGIANYVGITQDIPSTCYNPAALGGACLKNLKGQLNLDERIKKQSIIRIKRDPVSSPKMQVRLAALVFLVLGKKITTPQSLGTTYQASFADLPPEHRNCFSAHREIALSSLYDPPRDS